MSGDELGKMKRNIKLYFWFQLFHEPLFWGPILISYLQEVGKMTLGEIFIMEGVVMVVVAITEVLTGSLADTIGRKKTMLIGSFLLVLDAIGFSLASQPLHVWIANIIWAIGFSFCSGADKALFYDSLKKISECNGGSLEKEAKKREGRSVGQRYLLLAFTSLAAGNLYEIHERLPLLLSIPCVIFSFSLIFFMTEPERRSEFSLKKQFEVMKSGFVTVFTKKHLAWLVLFGLFLGTISKAWFFTYNPYFDLVQISKADFGYIFFALNIIAWFFTQFSYKIEELIGEKGCVILMMSCLGFPILLMGIFVKPSMTLLVLVQNVTRGIMGPFFFCFLNQRVKSHNRATVISVKSSIIGWGHFFVSVGFGLIIKEFSLPESLKLLGVTTLFLGVIFYVWYLRLISEEG